MNERYVDYAQEEAITQETRDLLERDAVEAFDQLTQEHAAMVGRRRIEDLPPRERKALYAVNPPIAADGMPPLPQEGIFPNWYALSAEFPKRYQWFVGDAVKLMAEELEATDEEP